MLIVLQVGPNYPHEPPKVKCETAVYHPNIDLEGNVCLNILREDWKPVLTVNSIVYGLQYLFLVCGYIFWHLVCMCMDGYNNFNWNWAVYIRFACGWLVMCKCIALLFFISTFILKGLQQSYLQQNE